MSTPRITKISLENFKAFQDEEEFEIKPITLVYGYNSSGKSSFLHSLLFLDEFMRSGNVDVHRPTLGGGEVDLGGYNQFVNRAVEDEYGPSRISFEIQKDKHSSRVQFIFSFGHPPGREPVLEDLEIKSGNQNFLLQLDREENKNQYYKIISKHHSEFLDLDEINFDNLRVDGKSLCLNLKLDFIQRYTGKHFAEPYAFEKQFLETSLFKFWERSLNLLKANFYGSDRIQYLGPLRSIPNRTELAWGAHGGKSDMEPWNRIRNEPEVRGKVNDVLAEIFPQKNGNSKYRFDVIEFGRTDQAEEAVPDRSYYKNLSSDSSKVRDGILEKVSLIQEGDSDLSLSDIQVELDKLEELEQLQVRVRVEKPKSGKKRDAIRKLVLLDLSNDENPIEVSLQDIGVGVGHLIPLLVAEIAAPPGTTLITDSAEVYLHPKQHAIEADTCIRTAMMGGVCHIRETHSEFFLDRILRRIGEADLKRREGKEGEIPEGLDVKADDVAIYFVLSSPERDDDGNSVKVRRLKVRDNGKMVDKWPEGFFSERFEDLCWYD